jgi:hypothetical protein
VSLRYRLSADRREELHSEVLELFQEIPGAGESGTWLRGIRIRPEPAACVHDLRIELLPPAGAAGEPELLYAWTPLEDGLVYPPGSARALPRPARLGIHARCRRSWRAPKEAIEVSCALDFLLDSSAPRLRIRSRKLQLGGGGSRIAAVESRPAAGDGGIEPARIIAITPIADQEPAARLRMQIPSAGHGWLFGPFDPDWPIRYRLKSPLEIEDGLRFSLDGEAGAAVTVWLDLIGGDSESR